MLRIEDYAAGLFAEFPFVPRGLAPWEIVARLAELLGALGDVPGFRQVERGLYVHSGAAIETGSVVKPPAFIGDGCFVAAHAYLRGGVALGRGVSIGPGCEVKASLVSSHSALAHLNFVGDSIIGVQVNIEAGAVIANHWNERDDEPITVVHEDRRIATGAVKFGALVGDFCRIGANAVLSPGTLLRQRTIVARLQLIDQSSG
jgi:bifunctional N-acetylglucosamine-1-phosphate-uridyltransferase/glucosamine-1-phosphate-acetyltransferase GlmU-like protein